MNIVYICSPYRATDAEALERNIEYAKALTRAVLLRGECPVTPHLFMTMCLDESIKEERNIGLAAGQAIIEKCEKMLVGSRFGISEGMVGEIKKAKEKGISIQYHE